MSPRTTGPAARWLLTHLAAFSLFAAMACEGAGSPGSEPPAPHPSSADCLQDVAPLDFQPSAPWKRHWQRLVAKDCKPGSWLVRFPETGQNMAQFRAGAGATLPRTAPLQVGTMAQPLSDRDQDLVPLVLEFSAAFFQLDVTELDAQKLPESARSSRRGEGVGQYDAMKILEAIGGTCSSESAACLRLTGEDLYIPGLKYVFGLAHYGHRVGVVSLHRIWEPRHDGLSTDSKQLSPVEPLRRLLKIATHELAHQFSISHCVHYRNCLMAGTSSVRENDAGRLALCPLDFAKLEQGLGFVSRDRFAQLADFATRNKLHPEARYWQQMAAAYQQVPRDIEDGSNQ